MKIAVINFSGNVGKSTIARHLLSARMPDAVLVSVESINADSASEQTIRGTAFGQLQQDLQMEDSAIVDVGASNVEQFLALMRQYDQSHEDYDLFLVPTVAAPKQQKDTCACVSELIRMGVPPSKISIIFNLVEPGEDVATVFEAIFTFVQASRFCSADPEAVIFKNDVFALLRDSGQSVSQVIADETDYKAKIRDATDPTHKRAFAERLSVYRLAVGVNRNLDAVFERVITPCQAG